MTFKALINDKTIVIAETDRSGEIVFIALDHCEDENIIDILSPEEMHEIELALAAHLENEVYDV